MRPLDISALLTQREKRAAIETSARVRFTYVPLPKDIVDKLTAVQAQVAPSDGLKQDLDHITLVYVKKTDEDVPQADIDKAARTIRDIVSHTPPISAKVQGWGYFDGAKKDGVDKTALVGLIDAPGLEDLHVELKGALRSIGITPSADHIFTPHVTFCYLEKGKRVENLPTIGGEFTVDKVCFVNADVHEMVLGSAIAEQHQKAAGALIDAVKSRGIKQVLTEYGKHTALNAGQAARDARFLFDHPDATGALASLKKRAPSLAQNSFYAAIPPHWHHTAEDLKHLDAAPAKDWFRHGYKPWEQADPLAHLNTSLPLPEAVPKTAASALRSRTSVVPYPHGSHPGYGLNLNGKEIGRMALKPQGGQIQGAEIDPAYRGLGLGKKFYGEVMRRQPGQTLRSDGSPSVAATRVWESMARDPSYKTSIGEGWKAPGAPGYPYRHDLAAPTHAPHTFEGALPAEAALPDPHAVAPTKTGSAEALARFGLSTVPSHPRRP